ncbi:MAG: hypothetical protein AAB903_03870 [Patescibacteria group bacterium]
MIDKILKFVGGVLIGSAFTAASAFFGNIFFNALWRTIPGPWPLLAVSWSLGVAFFIFLVYVLRLFIFGKYISNSSLIFGVVVTFLITTLVVLFGMGHSTSI